MRKTRRDILRASAAVAGGLSLGPDLALASDGRAERSLRLLVLGGTGFIGPHLVKQALLRGHRVTVFTRGRSPDSLPAGVERLVGDRDARIGAGLSALRNREWDAVIDNTGYVPRHVRDSVDLLRDAVGRYLFTSTVTVYDMSQERLEVDSRLTPVLDPEEEDYRGEHYGSLKVLCEEVVQERLGARGTIVRPHIVAGPGDRSDRYTYWVARLAQGGEVLAPGDPGDPVQYIDVRDLAAFFVTLLENDQPGVFNGAGPTPTELSLQGLLSAMAAVIGAGSRFTWVPDAFLTAHGVPRYPLWISQNNPEVRGATRVDISGSLDRGLTLRPLGTTALDTLAWWRGLPATRRGALDLHLARDAAVLKAWNALA